jgi:hypothetical protein
MKYILLAGVLALGLITGCGQKKAATEKTASLEELNRALTVVAMRAGYSPPPTNALAKFLALTGKTMPVPPPGKKLVIDPAKRQFVLVDE